MGNAIGYARVSTDDQSLSMQIEALEAAGCARVFSEVGSGKSRQGRTELAKALDYLNPGDTLAVWRLDRLGRNTVDLITMVNDLNAQDIEFRSLTEAIDTSTSGGRFILTIFSALATMEREIISERTKAGLASAAKQGRKGGRPPKLSSEQVQTVIDLRDGGTSISGIARSLGVSRDTIRKAINSASARSESDG